MRRKVLAQIILVALMVVLVASCANFHRNTFRTLNIAANTYEAGMGSLKYLHVQGLVSDAEKDKAVELGEKYWAAYHSAVEAFEGYSETMSVEDKDKTARALAELAEFCGDLLRYLNPILIKHGQEPLPE